MAASSASSMVPMLFGLLCVALLSVTSAQSTPAPAPTSDGTSIDQAVAYVLMLLALVLTYLIH